VFREGTGPTSPPLLKGQEEDLGGVWGQFKDSGVSRPLDVAGTHRSVQIVRGRIRSFPPDVEARGVSLY
jgi:hypothetical protein